MGDYVCNQCNKKFNRKWNALRHNSQIHHGLAIVYNKTTGFIFQDSKQSNNMTDFDPIYEYDIEQQNIVDIFGKLVQPFSELEKEFDGNASDKINYLYTLVVGALNSSDPVKMLQDALNFYRSAKGKAKIVSYVAKGMGIDNIRAEQYLNGIIRNSKYFKNYTKLDHTRL
ncbi:MAG TPA: hypothetical protein VFT71_01330 [Candidatus Nitrosocosmicus sp.]|nr:hypothetical protein [Candidatus Nitrosocosmicus sp.]